MDVCKTKYLNYGNNFNGICLCLNGFIGKISEEEGESGWGWLKYLAIIGALCASGPKAPLILVNNSNFIKKYLYKKILLN